MAPAELHIELVWSPAEGDVQQAVFTVAPGTTVGQALALQQVVVGQLKVGVWGRIRALETLLQDRDRIEVYRPLTVDPMEGRPWLRRRQMLRPRSVASVGPNLP